MKTGNKQRGPVGTPTLIIAGVGLLAIGYFLLAPSSRPTGQRRNPPEPAGEIQLNNQPVANEPTATAGEAPAAAEPEIALSGKGRDPFAPPDLVRNSFKNKSIRVNGGGAVNAGQPFIRPVTNQKSDDGRPVWQGTLGSDHDRIDIVKFKRKAYFLRLGDRLPGTDYYLANIEKNYLLLLSPAGQLKLEREKGARKE